MCNLINQLFFLLYFILASTISLSLHGSLIQILYSCFSAEHAETAVILNLFCMIAPTIIWLIVSDA